MAIHIHPKTTVWQARRLASRIGARIELQQGRAVIVADKALQRQADQPPQATASRGWPTFMSASNSDWPQPPTAA